MLINGKEMTIGPFADLRGANLLYTDLNGADLYGANLYGANLYGANLYGANLSGASLRCADLRGADLRDADLRYADLRDADLTDVKLPHFQIPQEGELIVYKKLSNGAIAKLLVPENARRTATPVGRKCRAEFVEVLQILNNTGTREIGISSHDNKTVYRVGDTVYPDKYDDDIRIECTNGIHFFLTRKEAEEY
jgi:Family of unknown function (DUF5758)/Pentapeptide repeats (8 copies)